MKKCYKDLQNIFSSDKIYATGLQSVVVHISPRQWWRGLAKKVDKCASISNFESLCCATVHSVRQCDSNFEYAVL